MNPRQIEVLRGLIRNEERLLPSLQKLAERFIALVKAGVEPGEQDRELEHLREGLELMLNWDTQELQIISTNEDNVLFTANVRECNTLLGAIKTASADPRHFDLEGFTRLLRSLVTDTGEKWRRYPTGDVAPRAA